MIDFFGGGGGGGRRKNQWGIERACEWLLGGRLGVVFSILPFLLTRCEPNLCSKVKKYNVQVYQVFSQQIKASFLKK